MASSIYDWSNTAASNATADSDINWAEGQEPGTVNDSAREMMRKVATFREMLTAAKATTGTGAAYVLTYNHVPDAYVQGLTVAFECHLTNTGAATLNVGALGAASLRRNDGTALAAGDLVAGSYYIAMYDTSAGHFYVLNLPGTVAVTASSLTVTGATNLTGTFTSKGIDDNATTTALTIADGSVTIEPTSDAFDIFLSSTNDVFKIASGTSGDSGANVALYGETHATKAFDIEFRTGVTQRLFYDSSEARWDFNTEDIWDAGTITGDVMHATNTGNSAAPALAVDSDGAGSTTGIYGTNTGTSDYLRFTVDGVLQAGFVSNELLLWSDGTGASATPYAIHLPGSVGTLKIAGGSTGDVGGNLVLYGQSHATQAGDWELRDATTNILHYDKSSSLINVWKDLNMTSGLNIDSDYYYSNNSGSSVSPVISLDTNGTGSVVGVYASRVSGSEFLGLTVAAAISAQFKDGAVALGQTGSGSNYNILKNNTAGYLYVGGSTGLNTGGGLLLYGNTHVSNANNMSLRVGGSDKIIWNDDGTYAGFTGIWDFNGNALTDSPCVPRAWCNFNAAGTIAADYNVSTITDHGTGQWTVNFTSTLPSASYAVVGAVRKSGTSDRVQMVMVDNATAPTTSACRVRVGGSETSITVDPTQIYVAMFDD